MFWSLKKCLCEFYDKNTHRIWVKIFSTMLDVIVPIAVHYELDHKKHIAEISRVGPSFSWKEPSTKHNKENDKSKTSKSKKVGWLSSAFGGGSSKVRGEDDVEDFVDEPDHHATQHSNAGNKSSSRI